MTKDELFIYSLVLSILFLPIEGFPGHLHPSRFRTALDVLLESGYPPTSVDEALTRFLRAGAWECYARLQIGGLLDWAHDAARHGYLLTILDPEYPRVLRQKLGTEAPPVLWRTGHLSERGRLGILSSESLSTSSKFIFHSMLPHHCGLAVYSLQPPENGFLEIALAGVEVLEVAPSGRMGMPCDGLGSSVSFQAPRLSNSPDIEFRSLMFFMSISQKVLIFEGDMSPIVERVLLEASRRRLTEIYMALDGTERWRRRMLGMGAVPFIPAEGLLTPQIVHSNMRPDQSIGLETS